MIFKELNSFSYSFENDGVENTLIGIINHARYVDADYSYFRGTIKNGNEPFILMLDYTNTTGVYISYSKEVKFEYEATSNIQVKINNYTLLSEDNIIDLGEVTISQGQATISLPTGTTIEKIINADKVKITIDDVGLPIILPKISWEENDIATFALQTEHKEYKITVAGEAYSGPSIVLNSYELALVSKGIVSSVTIDSTNVNVASYDGTSKKYYNNKLIVGGTTYNAVGVSSQSSIDIDSVIDSKIQTAIGNALEADY